MLKSAIGSCAATATAVPVVPKSLASAAFFVHWLLLVRYSSFSASSISMFMSGYVIRFSQVARIQSEIIFPAAGLEIGLAGVITDDAGAGLRRGQCPVGCGAGLHR